MQATAMSIEAPRQRTRRVSSSPKTTQTDSNRQLRVVGATASWIGSWLFSLFVIAALYYGWRIRDEGYLTAESGLGYALGITGGTIRCLGGVWAAE